MLFDKDPKLPPIIDFEVLLRYLSGFGSDIPCFGLALKPQVNCIATDIEQLARLTFLETIQLDCLHDFFPEVITVGLSHGMGLKVRATLLVYSPNLGEYSYIDGKSV